MRIVYAETASFPRQEIYGLTSQMRRASVSVLSNIAEGEGRLTDGERRHMLSQARGSLFEVEAQAIAANKLGYLSEPSLEKLDRQIRRTGKALLGFIAFVETKPRNPVTPRPRDPNITAQTYTPPDAP